MSRNINRQEKLDNIIDYGNDAYPRDFPNRVTIKSVIDCHFWRNNSQGAISKDFIDINKVFKLAGRIMSRRDHGNNIFFNLMDQTGEIQLHVKENRVGEKKNPCLFPLPDGRRCCECETCQVTPFLHCWDEIQECDLGDMIGVEGTLGANPRGEPLLQISNWTLLAKALIEPPDKRHGITEPEVKYRHRERDLISSAESRALFKTRAEIVFEIRKYLNERDFVEIECPVLQPIYGGATARPFKTKHNALGQNFYLSISSELYLKRAIVGGFDRVYSFSRCFRNEGISPTHNPEFTNLEIFETCKNDIDMITFVEELIEYTAHSIGSLVPTNKVVDADLPAQNWPLSRKVIGTGRHWERAEAWEMYINGMEIASGASDLNDPKEQGKRFKKSEYEGTHNSLNKFGNKNLIADYNYDPYDQNYIEALEMGALPWAGVGIGIDRLMMLLTNHTNIRDVILFPTLKNKND